ncbi:MAG TPA: redoxin domain-containing protein [Actinomycetota bacterium]|nr:redoxin domain-containing protein [Actinomycetota bacterium]
MQQVVDLQNSKSFRALGVELLSISPDSVQDWATNDSSKGIRTPTLSDAGNRVASAYGVMRWMPTGEPGHTFVLGGKDGRVAWIRDYGSPEHGGVMYVRPTHLVPLVAAHLGSA